MRKTIAALLLASLAACTTRTAHGECIGVSDEKDPNLQYKVSGWNVALGIIFIETIFVPVIVVVDDWQCPVARKAAKP